MINCDFFFRKPLKFFFALALLCGAALPGQAQIDPERLKLLQQKYDWGSIYLSYAIMPDIIQVLENQVRLQKIRTAYNSSPPQSMVTLLSRYRSPSSRRSIMLFQLNFSAKTPVAGFLTSYDLNGTINKAPMSPDEVLAAANWIDLYLTNGNQVANTIKILGDPKTTLVDAWIAIKKLNDNVFVSEDRIASLLAGFKQLQDNREKELEGLKTTDPRLYRTLTLFSTQYESTITAFFQEFMNAREDNIKKAPHDSPYQAYRKERQDEIVQGWVFHNYNQQVYGNDIEAQQDLLKLKIYQTYQQLIELEDRPKTNSR